MTVLPRTLPLALLLVACDPRHRDDGDGDTSCADCSADTGSPGCSISGVSAKIRKDAETVAEVRWETSLPASGRVRYGLQGDVDLESEAAGEGTTDHVANLVGLKAGRTYDFRVVADCEDGERAESQPGTFEVPPTPRELSRLEVTRADQELAQPDGYVLVTQIAADTSWVVLVDRQGDYVWYRPTGDELLAFTAKPSRDGHGVSWCIQDTNQLIDRGATYTVPFYGAGEQVTCNPMGHHDFVELPDGRLAFLAVELQWAEVGGEEEYVAADAIREIPLGSTDCNSYRTVFSFFEDYDAEPWPSSPEFYAYPVAGGRDWTHANSLVYEPHTDDYFLGARNLDAILRIDRATGEVLWQMGGRDSDFTFASDEDRWSQAHFSEVWSGGMILFDSGAGRIPQVSRVAEYAWDEKRRTVELVWEHEEPDGGFVPMGGDARRLPNGNVLISWSTLGRITEVTRDGRVVWMGEMPVGSITGRVRWLPEMVGPDIEDSGGAR